MGCSHAHASCLCIGAALLPDETCAGLDEPALLDVEAAGNGGIDAEKGSMEDAVCVGGGTDVDVGARRLLGLHCGEGSGRSGRAGAVDIEVGTNKIQARNAALDEASLVG